MSVDAMFLWPMCFVLGVLMVLAIWLWQCEKNEAYYWRMRAGKAEQEMQEKEREFQDELRETEQRSKEIGFEAGQRGGFWP